LDFCKAHPVAKRAKGSGKKDLPVKIKHANISKWGILCLPEIPPFQKQNRAFFCADG
jgi:hypothetical protein